MGWTISNRFRHFYNACGNRVLDVVSCAELAKSKLPMPEGRDPEEGDEEGATLGDIVRETIGGEREEVVHFSELASVKNRWENIKEDAGDGGVVRTGKRWQPPPKDEHADAPVPVVTGGLPRTAISARPVGVVSAQEYENLDIINRDESELQAREQEELPPVEITRSLVDKFRQLEANVGSAAAAPLPTRKPPMRPRTPPRENPMFNAPREATRPAEEPEREVVRETDTLEMAQGGIVESEPAVLPDVVRESDGPQVEELPESGMARNILAKFQTMEDNTQPPPRPVTSSRKSREVTRPSVTHVTARTASQSTDEGRAGSQSPASLDGHAPVNGSRDIISAEEAAQQHEGGVFENLPEDTREDIMRETDAAPEEELPEQGTSRSLIAQWSQFEQTNQRVKTEAEPPRRASTKWHVKEAGYIGTKGTIAPKGGSNYKGGSVSSMSVASDDVTSSPLMSPRGEAPQTENGGASVRDSVLSENSPSQLPDVVRESDKPNEEEELPASGTARSLLERYQQTVTSHHQDARPAPKKTGKAFILTAENDHCEICGKVVYAMEKAPSLKDPIHLGCFKCKYCNQKLEPWTYVNHEGELFCEPHFKQLFASKGNYDEGFGRQNYSKRWLPSDGGEAAPEAVAE